LIILASHAFLSFFSPFPHPSPIPSYWCVCERRCFEVTLPTPMLSMFSAYCLSDGGANGSTNVRYAVPTVCPPLSSAAQNFSSTLYKIAPSPPHTFTSRRHTPLTPYILDDIQP
jgi:hypothetical protein